MTLQDLYSLAVTLAGLSIAVWAAWRINTSAQHGEWPEKLSAFSVFLFGGLWEIDRLMGYGLNFDGPAFMVSIAAALWIGSWRRQQRKARDAKREPRTIKIVPTPVRAHTMRDHGLR